MENVSDSLRDQMLLVSSGKYSDEIQLVSYLLENPPYDSKTASTIEANAARIVNSARTDSSPKPLLDTFLAEYGLSTREGVALMCLAESLLRIPDQKTADQLIADKVKLGNWAAHAGNADSLLVNASTWALMLTGRFVEIENDLQIRSENWFEQVTGRISDSVIKKAMRSAMQILGREFVLGTTIEDALGNSEAGKLYSYDMLGEAARNEEAAQRYYGAYRSAIENIGRHQNHQETNRPSISIKLSALHPRFESLKRHRIMNELLQTIIDLCGYAKRYNVELTIDAEEADRTELTLDLFRCLITDPNLQDFRHIGIVVQAYSKRAIPILDWLILLGKETDRTIPVRLVKGAYWDTEIKHAQVNGLPDFPVYTRKASTDLSYLLCTKKILQNTEQLYGQFATHNAHTVSAILELAQGSRDFELQRLHGMGVALYDAVKRNHPDMPPLRVYAPVGSHEDLLAYLVRRLLENGANSSFVNRFLDQNTSPADLVRDPINKVRDTKPIRHPYIRIPSQLFMDERINSQGLDFSSIATIEKLCSTKNSVDTEWFIANSLPDKQPNTDKGLPIKNPAKLNDDAGIYIKTSNDHIDNTFLRAKEAYSNWNSLKGNARAALLNNVANLLDKNLERLTAILCREAGKTFFDSVSETREAIDFCRYYASQAKLHFEGGTLLPGPTGETNELTLHGRGVFVCISPWNFPLAIFVGQIAAALASGNTVVAKPAEHTPFIAFEVVRLMYNAGIPHHACQLVLGDGSVGEKLVEHQLTAGIAFTGSFETARQINQLISQRAGPLIPFIAETGGQNVMIVDSTALLEQVTDDVVVSAFHSAGQRCSALRVLYLQEDIAHKAIEMIKGAMNELRIGDPGKPDTDIGPIISKEAADSLQRYIDQLAFKGQLIHQAPVTDETSKGSFVAPCMLSIQSLAELEKEHFGPLLHVITFSEGQIGKIITDVEQSGYGLTLGIHSRIESRVHQIAEVAAVGNIYSNRNMIGAVVGSQPFGGLGFSGTGPKAGGPHYVYRFATEKVLTINTAATGGNAALLSLEN
ncbi:MAG: bifunctional proline dehydrogenase/L-glutamate gamma-semialdehyde dehydrogenase [Acidiferrobacteraceae bacterium]|nr:bifunctional proline dehydrogenase/L-glutamate gamma-semialdehyde dehydrogenase [Acidiferrobacteraceae bacterium]